MKKWPKKNKTVMFSELADSVRGAIEFTYKFERQNMHRNVPWSGYDIGEDVKAGCTGPEDSLKKNSLAWELDDQGRDALDVIIRIALQLGIEQGRRGAQERICSEIDVQVVYVKGILSSMTRIASDKESSVAILVAELAKITATLETGK